MRSKPSRITILLATAVAVAACEPPMEAGDAGSELATKEGAGRVTTCAGATCEGVGAACSHDGDCGAGLACQATTATCRLAGTTGTECAGAGSCAPGHTCDTIQGLCLLDVAAPAWPRILNASITGPGGPCMERVDIDGDGAPDLRTTYGYDEGGHVVLAEESMGQCKLSTGELVSDVQRLACTSPDGSITRRTAWARDGLGRVRSISVDYEGDGVWDERTTYSYLTDGRLKDAKQDLGADDTVDGITSWTWEGGQLATMAMDKDADGQPERVIAYAWSDAGYLVGQTEDANGDGVVDATTAWEYDAAGQPTQREWDGYGAWVMTNPTCGTGSHPKGSDGTLDKRVQWTWGPSGRLTGEKTVWFLVNKGFSGTWYVYDAAGRVAKAVRQGLDVVGTTGTCNQPVMGIAQQTWSFDWACGE